MLKRLSRQELEGLLVDLAVAYRLQVPRLLADGTRVLAPFGGGELSLHGEPVQRKPTDFFFPQSERLLTLNVDGRVDVPAPQAKPLALFGLNHRDLAGIAFLDRFFAAPPADDAYWRNRQGAILIGLTGNVGPDRAFLPLTEGNCDLEIIGDGDDWLAVAHSDSGNDLLRTFSDGDRERLVVLQKRGAEPSEQQRLLQAAGRLLAAERVPDAFWAEIGDRCILCSGCNLVCPTCNCFCVVDRVRDGRTERSRCWDSCQLDAFMREASGHNPLGTEALRTRRRIHHKLVADVERWGESGCVACGRCDRTCPTGIGIMAVAEEMVQRFADGS